MMRRFATTLTLIAGVLWGAPTLAVPTIEHWRTNNGAEVYFVQARDLPIVDVRLTFDAGGARDRELPGLARLTNSLVTDGTPELEAGTIARRFEDQGTRLSSSSQQDMAYLGLRSLSKPKNLKPSIALFERILADASFPADQYEQRRRQMLVGLRQAAEDPGTLAERRLRAAIYGDHPYATPAEGTVSGLQAVSREDVMAFYRRYYVARNLTLAIVGDLDRARAEAIAERLAGARPAGEAPPELPAVAPVRQGETLRVHVDSQQTHIEMGQPAVRRGAEDWHALYTANHILGGSGLTSRLAMEMRERRGLSYSTGSYFAPAARAGRFGIATQVRNDRREEALEVLRETLRRYYEQGPTADELSAAKRHITGSFPLQLNSNRDILGYVAMIGFYDLPLDYLQRFREQIDTLTLEAVHQAFRNHVDPERLVTVMAGPFPDTEGE